MNFDKPLINKVENYYVQFLQIGTVKYIFWVVVACELEIEWHLKEDQSREMMHEALEKAAHWPGSPLRQHSNLTGPCIQQNGL